MSVSDLLPLGLLLGVALASGLVALCSLRSTRKTISRQATELAHLQAELAAFSQANMAMGQQLATVQSALHGDTKAAATVLPLAPARGSTQPGGATKPSGPAQTERHAASVAIRRPVETGERRVQSNDNSGSEPRQKGKNQRTLALDLIRRGAQAEDLMATCELSRAEALLLLNLHQRAHA